MRDNREEGAANTQIYKVYTPRNLIIMKLFRLGGDFCVIYKSF